MNEIGIEISITSFKRAFKVTKVIFMCLNLIFAYYVILKVCKCKIKFRFFKIDF